MFHKGKRRRRIIAFAHAEPGTSLPEGFSELARIASSFEPTRYELADAVTASVPSSQEEEPEKVVGGPIASVRAAPEVSAGEKVFHFGCYSSAEKIYWERKVATGVDGQLEKE